MFNKLEVLSLKEFTRHWGTNKSCKCWHYESQVILEFDARVKKSTTFELSFVQTVSCDFLNFMEVGYYCEFTLK